MVRLSLSTVTPAGLSCALAEKVAEKKTTAIIEGRFMRFSNPIVRARNGHTNPKRKRADDLPHLRFGLVRCTFAHGPVALLTSHNSLTLQLTSLQCKRCMSVCVPRDLRGCKWRRTVGRPARRVRHKSFRETSPRGGWPNRGTKNDFRSPSQWHERRLSSRQQTPGRQ